MTKSQSIYALITLTSIVITRILDKIGFFKAITLCPFLSDIVYWLILENREMKDNLYKRLFVDYKNKAESIKKLSFTYELLKIINEREFDISPACSHIKLQKHFNKLQNRTIPKHPFPKDPHILLEFYLFFICLKHFCHPKSLLNTRTKFENNIRETRVDFPYLDLSNQASFMVSASMPRYNTYPDYYLIISSNNKKMATLVAVEFFNIIFNLMLFKSYYNFNFYNKEFPKVFDGYNQFLENIDSEGKEELKKVLKFFKQDAFKNMSIVKCKPNLSPSDFELHIELFLKEEKIDHFFFIINLIKIFDHIIASFVKDSKYTSLDFNQDLEKSQEAIFSMLDEAIKYGIVTEQKDGSLKMSRAMVRYFDIIEYGLCYQRKYLDKFVEIAKIIARKMPALLFLPK
jgi:hypothetical protein